MAFVISLDEAKKQGTTASQLHSIAKYHDQAARLLGGHLQHRQRINEHRQIAEHFTDLAAALRSAEQ